MWCGRPSTAGPFVRDTKEEEDGEASRAISHLAAKGGTYGTMGPPRGRTSAPLLGCPLPPTMLGLGISPSFSPHRSLGGAMGNANASLAAASRSRAKGECFFSSSDFHTSEIAAHGEEGVSE